LKAAVLQRMQLPPENWFAPRDGMDFVNSHA